MLVGFLTRCCSPRGWWCACRQDHPTLAADTSLHASRRQGGPSRHVKEVEVEYEGAAMALRGNSSREGKRHKLHVDVGTNQWSGQVSRILEGLSCSLGEPVRSTADGISI